MKNFQEQVQTFIENTEKLFSDNNFIQTQKDNGHNPKKIAVFDLDNTLIDGDISDCVFAYIKSQGIETKITWDEFHHQLIHNTRKIFLDFPTLFENIKKNDIIHFTKEVLKLEKVSFIEKGKNYSTTVPKIKNEFVWLIDLLRQHNYEIGVISASPEDVVRTISYEFYKLESEKVRGIRSIFHENDIDKHHYYSNKIELPTTVIEGKEIIYKEMFDYPPILTAGDSMNDIFMLNLTHNNGVSLICNENIEKRQKIKQHLLPHINTIELHY